MNILNYFTRIKELERQIKIESECAESYRKSWLNYMIETDNQLKQKEKAIRRKNKHINRLKEKLNEYTRQQEQ